MATEANANRAGTTVHVAVGVIVKDGLCVIAKRPENTHLGGLWEFPGGKCEAGESVEQALQRELAEELGITVFSSSPMLEIKHAYVKKTVQLNIQRVEEFTGEPHSAEGQIVKWVPIAELANYEFPAANQPIIDYLLQP